MPGDRLFSQHQRIAVNGGEVIVQAGTSSGMALFYRGLLPFFDFIHGRVNSHLPASPLFFAEQAFGDESGQHQVLLDFSRPFGKAHLQ